MIRSSTLSALVLLALPLMAQDQDMVFISVNPCVIFDTRPVQGGTGPFAAGEERGFEIDGSAANFAAQGGTPGGCGVPGWSAGQPVARAVFINYVAIDPQGAGQLKAWAFDKTEPAQGALVNYQALTPPMNNSNGVISELRQDVSGPDLKVKALSAGTHVRGVILGYFTREHITGLIAATGLTGGGGSVLAQVEIAFRGVGLQQLNAAGSTAGQLLMSTGTPVVWSNAPGSTGPTGGTGPTGPAGPTGLDPERRGFTLTPIDTGDLAAVAIGIDGMGLISYFQPFEQELKTAHCENVGCTSFTTATIASLGTNIEHTSIAIGSDGLGLISFSTRGLGAGTLKVAHCEDIPCTSATIATLDDMGQNPLGYYTSLAIGSDGLGIISYQDSGGVENHRDLQVAHCEDIACTFATFTTLDSVGDTGSHSSIAIGSDGLALISYLNSTDGLNVAHCSNVACTAANPWTIASGGGAYTSITIGSDGLGLISSYDGAGLMVAHCTNVTCSNAVSSTVSGGASSVGVPSSISIGPDGLGLIAYYNAQTFESRIAHCSNRNCTSSTSISIAEEGAGRLPWLTMGSDGLGLVVCENAGLELAVVHLSNSLGIPHHRRR